MKLTPKAAKVGAVLILLLATLAACKPTERIIYAHHTDSTFASHTDTFLQVRTERDSVYLHDSVFVSQYAQGDTIYQVKHVTQYRDRIRLQRDTLWRERTRTEYQNHTDTIYIQTPSSPKETAQKAHPLQEFLARLAIYALLLASLWLWISRK